MLPEPARILDEYLVVSAKVGDRAAFALLVHRWQKRLVAHAWRLTGDQEAARVAVQTGWTEIVRGLSRLQDERAFPAWAYRIISRICARQIDRKMRKRNLTEALARELAPEPPDEDAGLEGVRLQVAIRALSPRHRATVALFYFEEMSVAEVAVALDVPEGTIKTRVMHARRKSRVAPKEK